MPNWEFRSCNIIIYNKLRKRNWNFIKFAFQSDAFITRCFTNAEEKGWKMPLLISHFLSQNVLSLQ